jgi:hypothetical protein
MRDECIPATADAEKFTIELNYRAAAATRHRRSLPATTASSR